MAIDTIKYSSTLHSQNYSTNFTGFPDSAITDIFSAISRQLNELKVSGRDSLFSVTQNLLIQEGDNSVKKVVKACLYAFPVIPTIIGATFIIDNVCKLFKNDLIEELATDLMDHYFSSEELLKELTDPLYYFSSKEYQNLKEELDSNLTTVIDKHNQTKNSLSEATNRFFEKLTEVKPNLNIHLKQSECALERFRKIIWEGKGFYERIEVEIENHKRTIKGYWYFPSLNTTTISSEIISPFAFIEKKILRLASEINSEVEATLASKNEVFKQKMNGYLNDLKKIVKQIDDLKFQNEKRECIQECLTVKVDSTEVTTCKTIQPKKENGYMAHLNKQKSVLEEAIKTTVSSYISFLDKTYVLLQRDFMSAIIENNREDLTGFLREAKLHLNSYDAKFPKQEKRELEDLIAQINTFTDIHTLIRKCDFKYEKELKKCKTLIQENLKLIEKTIKKLEELECLSKNSSLKHKYKNRLIEDSDLLQSTNSKLKNYCDKLISFQKELFIHKVRLTPLRLDVNRSYEERKYDQLSIIYNEAYDKLKSSTTIDISDICFKISRSSQNLFFVGRATHSF